MSNWCAIMGVTKENKTTMNDYQVEEINENLRKGLVLVYENGSYYFRHLDGRSTRSHSSLGLALCFARGFGEYRIQRYYGD